MSTKMYMKTNIFATSQTMPETGSRKPGSSGPAGPPNQSVTMTADIVTGCLNSATKNMPKRIKEYSVCKPTTRPSDASYRANGGRFGSARTAMKNTRTGTRTVRSTRQVGAQQAKPLTAC